jgi:hypothetical protein
MRIDKMETQFEIHNRIVGEIVKAIVKPPMDAGGQFTDVLVILESVILGVMLVAVKLGGDDFAEAAPRQKPVANYTPIAMTDGKPVVVAQIRQPRQCTTTRPRATVIRPTRAAQPATDTLRHTSKWGGPRQGPPLCHCRSPHAGKPVGSVQGRTPLIASGADDCQRQICCQPLPFHSQRQSAWAADTNDVAVPARTARASINLRMVGSFRFQPGMIAGPLFVA